MPKFRTCLVFLLTLTVATAFFTRALSSEEESVDALNTRIEAAIAEGRQWPRFPGGLADFLFGSESVVTQGCIYFCTDTPDSSAPGVWREVLITKTTDGTWRVRSVTPCDREAAAEYLDRREFLRNAWVERFEFDIYTQGPLEWLEVLKRCERNSVGSPLFPFGWVKESDLPVLMELIDSTEPCANVKHLASSSMDSSPSTVGNEAAFLVEGFRQDQYPPRLNSTRPPCDIEEIKAWWARRQGRGNADSN
jgi:hypothetical protein